MGEAAVDDVLATAVGDVPKGKETRTELIHGLLRLYADQDVNGYYDSALLKNYSTPYYLYILRCALAWVLSRLLCL